MRPQCGKNARGMRERAQGGGKESWEGRETARELTVIISTKGGCSGAEADAFGAAFFVVVFVAMEDSYGG